MRIKELRHNMWNIGFIEEGLKDTLFNNKPKIHWVKKRFNDRWFADPFILDVTSDEIIILAEEYCYEIKRGRIARIVIDRKTYEEKNFEIVLDLPTHLSFPFIFRKNGSIYIMPENSASGCSNIYRYDDSERKTTFIKRSFNDPFTDATIFKIQQDFFLWTTMLPDPNGMILSVYKFDTQKMEVGEKVVTIDFLQCTARNAGEVFELEGELYRPAQDCTKCYGNGIVLQKVTRYGEKWSFEDINSFYPNTFKYNQGLHTFNHYNGLIVIDARGYRNPILARIITFVFNILGRK